MKRRKFILATITAAATFALPVIIYRSRHRSSYDPLVRPDMLARFCDEDTVRIIGTHYLSLVPAERQIDKLKTLILKGKAAATTDCHDTSDWIGKRICKDFKEEKMIVVDGWIISETEARQCALFSLA